MTALEFLWGWPFLPSSIERRGNPSRSELRRWCRAHSVLINGCLVEELQEIPNFDQLGIWQLVFHPNSPKYRCTQVWETIEIITLSPDSPELIALSSDPPPEDPSRRDDGEPGVGQVERELIQ